MFYSIKWCSSSIDTNAARSTFSEPAKINLLVLINKLKSCHGREATKESSHFLVKQWPTEEYRVDGSMGGGILTVLAM